jgi:hypothetical protein
MPKIENNMSKIKQDENTLDFLSELSLSSIKIPDRLFEDDSHTHSNNEKKINTLNN